MEPVAGFGRFSPLLQLKYAGFYWVFKQKRFNPILSFLIRLVSVLVSVCRLQIYAVGVRLSLILRHTDENVAAAQAGKIICEGTDHVRDGFRARAWLISKRSHSTVCPCRTPSMLIGKCIAGRA
jgi:hypothetical protein